MDQGIIDEQNISFHEHVCVHTYRHYTDLCFYVNFSSTEIVLSTVYLTRFLIRLASNLVN